MKMLLPLAISAVALAQAGPQSFAGTWTAEQAGQTFVRLELRLSGSTLGGQISLGDIHVDKKGVVERAKAAPAASTPLLDVARQDGLLTFARKDGRDTDHFQLKVIDENTAELTFILSDTDRKELAAQGIPSLAPIKLTKQ
jgi:hypothetical protein